MKPTSIIFLIVSIVLVIGGFAMIGVSRQLAAAQGVELTAGVSDETGDYVYTYEYDADEIGKITVDIKDAKVNIIGGAVKPYVEIINFPDGMYEFSSSNRNLMISNDTDFSSLTGIASLVMNFKGLRSLINYYNISDLEKTVNIYLCDEYPVNVIDCRIDTGDVTITAGTTETDYNVEIDTGDLRVKDIRTDSLLKAVIETGDVEIDNSYINLIQLDLETGSAAIHGECRVMEAAIETGDLLYRTAYGIEYYNETLSVNVGKIEVAGEDLGGFYEDMGYPTSDMLEIDIGTGNITLENAFGSSD